MDNIMQEELDAALRDKKLNKVAYDEIVRWMTENEFEEFVPTLTEKIQNGDWDMLMDAFYRVVMFGTGGIRGVMDIGTNRINNYTIRWASQAYAQYLRKYHADSAPRGVAIAYDSRHHSDSFMKETARVLAANGIPVHIFKYYRATPELSFTVRHLKLAGGIVITASHNPPEFNGYKVYDADGVQVLPDAGALIEAEFNGVKEIEKTTFDEAVAKGSIHYIDDEVDAAFIEAAKKISVYPGRDATIAFSPLHGVGSQSVLPVLQGIGFKNIVVVEEQMTLDGSFPTVKNHFPNPELLAVYEKPIELAKKINADITIVSDPDADRLGIAIPDKAGNWGPLTGNQSAALLGYFYMNARHEAGTIPSKPVIIKTSVTSDLVRDIAESFGAEVIGDLLVGFKFIGERLQHLPEEKHFMFGCEESCGYLFGDAYRDKGAETPAVVAAEMAAWCKANKTTVADLLESIYKKYGYYAQRLYYRAIEGLGAFERMNGAMGKLRGDLPKQIGGRDVVKIIDRLTGEVKNGQTGALLETRAWDKGDMLSFFFSEDERNALHVRPSGTEAKMKYYTAIKGNLNTGTKENIEAEAKLIEDGAVKIFEKILSGVSADVF